MIQIWYPAECAGPLQAYRTFAETSFKTQHLALVRTHAARNVPVVKGTERFPVLIFTPSWNGRRNHNTVQAEELASHGFVVVGIDHPYGSEVVVFPDGRIVRRKMATLVSDPNDPEREAEDQLRIRAADVRFVLDEVERLDRADPGGLFTGRIDLARVGIFGHSFGGAVAAEICLTEPRVKAGVNLDGLIYGEAMTNGFAKPFMYLSDDRPIPSQAQIDNSTGAARRELTFLVENVKCIKRGLAGNEGYWAIIRGASHVNFCDSPYYSSLKRVSGSGLISPDRAMGIINAYLLSFFRKYLTQEDDHLLDTASNQFPEVEMERPITGGN
jgi:predicted dienelactone hydrolase